MTTIDEKSKMKILRQKAEELLKNNLSKISAKLLESETSKLLHELEVYQIELEMQNKELKQANTIARETADKYTELYDFAPIGYFILSKKGEIVNLNLTGSSIIGKERSYLKNSKFSLLVSSDTITIFNQFLNNIFRNKGKETCEVTILVNGDIPLDVYLTGIVTENANHCSIILIDITELNKNIRKDTRITKGN